MTIQLHIEGIDELLAILEKGGNKEDLANVVRKHGGELHKKATRACPVDTGELKRSLDLTNTDGGLSAKVRTAKHYAIYVEMGTRKMAAQPYLKPSLNAQEGPFLNDLRKVVEK